MLKSKNILIHLIYLFTIFILCSFTANAENARYTMYTDTDYNWHMIMAGDGPIDNYDALENSADSHIPMWRKKSPECYIHSLKIEDSITRIGDFAFYKMTNLNTVFLPNTLLEIGSYSFASCSNQFEIHIPESVRYISDTAFTYNDNVIIYCPADSYAHNYAKRLNYTCVISEPSLPPENPPIVVPPTISPTEIILSAEKLTLFIGEQHSLSFNVLPTNATYSSPEWKSSNSQIVSVTKTGEIVAHKKGTAQITVIIKENNTLYKDTCSIEVSSPISLSKFDASMSAKKITFTGNEEKPKVIILSKDNTPLMENVDYTISATSNCTKVGRHKLLITGIGKYTGTQKLYYTIVPPRPTNSVADLYKKNAVKYTWDKVDNASGYAIYYKKNSGTYKFIKRTTKTYVKKSGLSAGAQYTFKVVPYYKSSSGTRYLSLESSTSSTYTLKKISKPIISLVSDTELKLNWTNISGETGYQISRSSSKSGTYIISTLSDSQLNNAIITSTRKKTYYYKIRAYKIVDDKTIYGTWSDPTKYKLK